MNNSEQSQQQQQQQQNERIPLANVVLDCTRMWFRETLREAKSGDPAMQLLVAQMYNTGYGTPKEPQEGRNWIHRASLTRSSTSNVCGKRPGYNASESDSDSDDGKADAKEDS